MAHAHGVQRVVREQVEGAAILATEEDVVWTLGDLDAVEELSCGGVDEDLAGGEINVAVRVLGQAFSTLLDKGNDLSKGAVSLDLAAVGALLGLVGGVEGLPRHGFDQAITFEDGSPFGAE